MAQATTDPIRQAVYHSLLAVVREGRYANLELNATLARKSFTEPEKAFYTRLFYGVIEREIALDTIIDAYAEKPSRIKTKVRILLRMGIYQLLYMDAVPDHAATNETVALTKKETDPRVGAFVNRILRTVIAHRNDLPLPPAGSLERLSFESGIPMPILSLWEGQYGKERTRAIALATTRIPPLTLKVNTLKTDTAALLARLRAEGTAAEETAFAGGIRLCAATPIDKLSPLKEGLCFVQDAASQIAAATLGARPGERVLDVCACPGGKSFAIAIGMENRGQVHARDLHENKLSLIEAGADRLGISIIQTKAQDGKQRLAEDEGQFDRVLCDVPCSGLGVIAKKPDLRRKSPEEIARLPEIQKAILESACHALRPRGVLVYSTCTLNQAENEAVVSAFLSAHEEFTLAPEGMRTFFPDEGTDGFFICKMQKR